MKEKGYAWIRYFYEKLVEAVDFTRKNLLPMLWQESGFMSYFKDVVYRYSKAIKSCYDWVVKMIFAPCWNLFFKICTIINRRIQYVHTEFISPCYSRISFYCSKIFESICLIAGKFKAIIDTSLTYVDQKFLNPCISVVRESSKLIGEKILAPAYNMIVNMIDKISQAIIKFNAQLNEKLLVPVLKSYGEVIKALNKFMQKFF